MPLALVTTRFFLLVVRPGATSSVLAPTSIALVTSGGTLVTSSNALVTSRFLACY